MTWFKVDDKLHSNNKIRKVAAEEPAALALWLIAGSWCSDNTNDGVVPDHQLPWLMPARGDELAHKLVSARLWRRVRGGYQFHDWTDWNPSREKVERERLAAAARQQRMRDAAKNRSSDSGSSRRDSRVTSGVTNGVSSLSPTRPPLKGEGRSAPASQGGARSSDCPHHRGYPKGTCGLCRSENLGRKDI